MTDTPKEEAARTITEEVTKRLTDEGRLIAGGFNAFLIACYGGASMNAEQHDQLRNAFFAGAQHTFSSIMTTLESGENPTENDMRRMTNILTELEEFVTDFEKRLGIG